MPEQGIAMQGMDKLPGILASSGMLREYQDMTDSLGKTLVGNTYGENQGIIVSDTLNGVISGVVLGTAISFNPIVIALTALAGGLVGYANGALKNYEKENDAFRSWYGGLYEKSLIDSEQRLSTGVTMAGMLEQERLLAEEKSLEDSYLTLLSNVEEWQSGFDAARGEGYIRTRENGLLQEQDTYEGGLGAELETANQMIGGSQAYLENKSGEYQQEALRAVLMDADLSVSELEWSDQVKEELARLADAYQEAKEAEAAGDETAGLLVSAYLREAEMLAQAQYDSSSEVRAAAGTEAELINTVRTIISPLSGWKNEYDISQELKKGIAPSKDGFWSKITGWNPEIESGMDKHEIWKHGVHFTDDGRRPVHETDEGWRSMQERAWGAAAEAPEYVPPRTARFVQYRSQQAADRRSDSHNDEAAVLRESARILTAWETRQQDRSVGDITVTVTGNEFQVRNQNDLDAVGNAIALAIERKMKAGVRR